MEVGVIVGRFQVHELHEAHAQIINSVREKHHKVVVFLGVSPVLCTKKNPLDFVARKQMLLHRFPDITVLSIPDHPSDEEWSKQLDNRIREAAPIGKVILYGGRDGFTAYYHGQFETKELEQTIFVSGSEVRQEVSTEVKSSPDFRAGVIYAAYNQYAKVYPTVDVAIIYEGNKLLLGKKANNPLLRFLGGFTDPTDSCYEEAAKREVFEEANIEIGDIEYIGSHRVDDWRYKSEEDKIITMLFTAKYVHGAISPKDDIAELRIIHFDELHENLFVAEHKPLFHIFKKFISKHKN